MTATESQMLEDYLAQIIVKHTKEYDPIMEEMVMGRLKDEKYDENINNEFQNSLQNIKILPYKIKLN